MIQKGIRSLVGEDARVGYKSKTKSFYGYKDEFVITTKEQIITAVSVENGAFVDGTHAKLLLEKTLKTTLRIKEIYGDQANLMNL